MTQQPEVVRPSARISDPGLNIYADAAGYYRLRHQPACCEISPDEAASGLGITQGEVTERVDMLVASGVLRHLGGTLYEVTRFDVDPDRPWVR